MTQQNGIVPTYDQAVESKTELKSTNKEHQLKVCCKKMYTNSTRNTAK